MSQNPSPSKVWFILHAFLGLISGLIVYFKYRSTNPHAAKMHIVYSLVIGLIVWGVVSLAYGSYLDHTLSVQDCILWDELHDSPCPFEE